VKAELELAGRPTVDHFKMRVKERDGTACDDMRAPLKADAGYIITL
jgi:hypothetical protein